jgi:putative oxidoreductase
LSEEGLAGKMAGNDSTLGNPAMNLDALASAWAPRLLSILRIMTGLLFLQHGTAKLLKIPVIPMFANLSLTSLPGIAGILELVGGVLIILGLFTRSVAFVLSGLMAVAYFMAHAPRGFYPILNAGELAILFCFVFLYFAAAGPGPWSIDAARRK